jgi:shikimate kinase
VQRVLLVGLPGAGASAVAEAVGAATGWPVLDDELVLQRSAGASADELLARGGEAALRSAESDVLTLLLSMPAPLVASVPSAVVLDGRDLERLRTGGHVVWLRASPATLVRRSARQVGRTRTADDPLSALLELAQRRDRLYASVATQVLDMDVQTPVHAARQIVAALSGPGAGPGPTG